jgi:hypothetical protein
VLFGCGAVLPFWSADDGVEFRPESLVDSVTDLTPLKFSTSSRPLKLTLNGNNVRQEIAKVAFELQVRFFCHCRPIEVYKFTFDFALAACLVVSACHRGGWRFGS